MNLWIMASGISEYRPLGFALTMRAFIANCGPAWFDEKSDLITTFDWRTTMGVVGVFFLMTASC
jgi:hypothetical protein